MLRKFVILRFSLGICFFMKRREDIQPSGVATTLVEAGASFQYPLRATAPAPVVPWVVDPSYGDATISSSLLGGAAVGAAAQLQTQPQQPVPTGPSPFGLEVRPKIGRPRKYPKPSSESMPPARSMKRGRGRPRGSRSKQKQRIDLESSGNRVATSAILFLFG